MSEESKTGLNKKVIAIAAAIIILLAGLLTYYFVFMGDQQALSPELEEEVNILIVGLDDTESVEKGEIESDAILLASFRAEEEELKLTAIPSRQEVNEKKLQKTSLKELPESVSDLTGSEPEYYFAMGYEGFEKIVDNLNGVEIELEDDLEVPDLGLYLEEGKNLLSGKEALNYARWFDHTGDEVDRLGRQKQLISAMTDKVLDSNNLLDIPKLYSTLEETVDSVEANIDSSLISDMYEFIRNRDNITIEHEIYEE